MYLTRHSTSQGSRWALDSRYLPAQFNLGLLLEISAEEALNLIKDIPVEGAAGEGPLLAPVNLCTKSGLAA